MIIVLKFILGMLALAIGYAALAVWKDFQATRKQEGYDELSIWRRIKFNLISFAMLTGMASLIVFLVYFIFAKIMIA